MSSTLHINLKLRKFTNNICTTHFSLLFQIGWTQPSLPRGVGFGWLGPHQPSVRMNRVQDLHKLTLFKNKTVLTSNIRTAVGSSYIYFKYLKKKTLRRFDFNAKIILLI